MGIRTNYSINEFRQIKGPILDVRSPKEYQKGHLPGAISLPLFSNDERHEIGLTYKNKGSKKAILLGLKFTGENIEKVIEKIEKLKNMICTNSPIAGNRYMRIYCWRGGMRSASVAWLAEILEINAIVLKGGYKSYRNWVLRQFEKKWQLKLIGGRTGTGKTDLLKSIKSKGYSIIDLEGLANHRGSSFGHLGLEEQPTNEQYENKIAEALNKTLLNEFKTIYLENESANLGKCRIPNELFKQMNNSSVIEIRRSKEERVRNLVEVYGNRGQAELKEATLRISKRLGPQRTKEALEAISEGKWANACCAILDYYDRCYDYELGKSEELESIDLSGLDPDRASEKLINIGLLN